MPLAHEPRSAPHAILGYSEGAVRLKDRVVVKSAIITASIVRDWPVRSVAELNAGLLEPVLTLGVEVVLLATGARQEFPARTVLARAAEARVGLEVMDLGAACRTYNVLLAEDRPVALAVIFPAPPAA
ncbi:MAG TPA: MTH938/NDUFAF3 family protein [Steroidobacteraceae bacterium]|nr:MTH938/NDUFAF3 family protein [Steroidobacteraceae bacterium]